jgi:hypothetical protein
MGAADIQAADRGDRPMGRKWLIVPLAVVLLAGAAHASTTEAGAPVQFYTLPNETRWAASGLHLLAAPGQVFGRIEIVSELSGCHGPAITYPPEQGGRAIEIEWPRACIPSGSYVAVRVWSDCDTCLIEIAGYAWTHDALGDPTCDGRKNSLDALAILQDVAGVIPNVTCAENSDVNGDGAGDGADAMLILQYSGGLLPSLPV